jgi:hypothetical protein
MRLAKDADIDPTLQGAPSVNQRSSGALSEGPQSLPSLKASGLLDSWNSAQDGASVGAGAGSGGGVGTWTTMAHSRGESQIQNPMAKAHTTLRTSPPDSHSSHESESTVRPVTKGMPGMPVGMPWLANEQTNRDR